MTYQGIVPTPFKVEEYISETEDTYTLVLRPPRGEFSFAPGQFNMLYLPGQGEVPISISGDPYQRNRVVHTIRKVGAVTKAQSRLRPGQMVGLRGPYGNSWPREAAEGEDILIVAGGIGLAPLRPLIYDALAHGTKHRRIILLYGARHPDQLLYREELQKWDKVGMEVEVTVDTGPAHWSGHVGVVTKLLPRLNLDPQHTTAYICGPEVMFKFTQIELSRLGMAHQRIYLSMERNMKCAVGFCGHCQYGPHFICKDGPIFTYDQIEPIFAIEEV